MRRAGATRVGRIGALLIAAVALAGGMLALLSGGAGAPVAAAVPARPQPLPLLQPLIDAVPSGGTLRLPAGRYQGPAQITRPMVLDGGGAATIEGDGRSTVLVVQADGVTVRGLHLRGSGDSQDRVDAGLELSGADLLAEDNTLEDVLFGLHLKGVSRSLVRGNRVTGKPLTPGMRGDALRLWNSRHNRVEDNRFERGRDLTLINSPDNQLRRNHFTDGRYGLHAVFSPRLLAEGNRLSHTGTGIVVLYSPALTLRGNQIAHALTDGGAGIVLKDSHDSLIEGNEVLHCAVGFKLDTGVEGRGHLQVRGNHFAHNIIGMFFYGEAGQDHFSGSRYTNNLTTVAVSAPGAGASHQWSGNDWDEYLGFDRDHDGRGDTPHDVLLFADRIWMETPLATFFRASPALELLDFLERLAPFTSPYRVLRDPSPRMAAPASSAS
ncbi:copper-binding periplasmic protein [Sphaerotilus microaerophilus]|uniref:Copper-binding periplasmic protein n=2 Tax=Sphaerotilus microaerophilus TaxID=2914710 RepID=A0ABN6PTH8_9BURK|nr:copper-binding periplasmic protein [Sphaerotilus sp. FB-5]